MYSIKSAPAGPGKSRVGPALYVVRLLAYDTLLYICEHYANFVCELSVNITYGSHNSVQKEIY
jgi:hypothetical protein